MDSILDVAAAQRDDVPASPELSTETLFAMFLPYSVSVVPFLSAGGRSHEEAQA
jgi:hypothetical protein